MKEEKLTKTELAKKMGISRPTLDKYLKEGFPMVNKDNINETLSYKELCRKRVIVENNITLQSYDLQQSNKELEEINRLIKQHEDAKI